MESELAAVLPWAFLLSGTVRRKFYASLIIFLLNDSESRKCFFRFAFFLFLFVLCVILTGAAHASNKYEKPCRSC